MLMVISAMEKNKSGKRERGCQDLAKGVVAVGLKSGWGR